MGIHLCLSPNNILIENTINNNSDGFRMNGNNISSLNNILIKNIVSSSRGKGLFFVEAADNLIIDSIINNSKTADIYSAGETSNNIFLNTTFRKENVTITSGIFYVKWYLDVYVNNTNGSALEDANVSITDVNDNLGNWSLTDSAGYIIRQNLTEYYQNSTGKYWLTNYTVNATKSSCSKGTEQVNLTRNRVTDDNTEVVLTLIEYACGDCNGDGKVTSADASYIIAYIYRNGPEPLGEADVNVDGRITAADATYIINYLFNDGPPPCEPY